MCHDFRNLGSLLVRGAATLRARQLPMVTQRIGCRAYCKQTSDRFRVDDFLYGGAGILENLRYTRWKRENISLMMCMLNFITKRRGEVKDPMLEFDVGPLRSNRHMDSTAWPIGLGNSKKKKKKD